jgi:hypothetical protein
MSYIGSAEAVSRAASVNTYDDDARRAQFLSIHRLLLRVALSAGNIFAWVIVFRLCLVLSSSLPTAILGVSVLYVLSHGISFFLTPLAGAALRHGVRRALVYGTLAGALSFVPLAALFVEGDIPLVNMFWMISAFAILQGIYRALYFVPYRTEEGATVSPLILGREAALAFIPALVGFLLTSMDAAFIIFTAIAMIGVTSITPLFLIRETHEPYTWTYGETMRELVARRNRSAIFLFMLDGIQGAALLFIWPLAVFLVLEQSFQALGAILTATLCIAFLGRFLMRKLLRPRVMRSPYVLAMIVFSTWILRLGVGTPVQILAVDVYYNSAASPRRFSVDPYAFEQAADSNHYVDEYTAVKEMALSVGRIAIMAIFIGVMLYGTWATAFIIAILAAGCAAAASVIISHRLQKAAY